MATKKKPQNVAPAPQAPSSVIYDPGPVLEASQGGTSLLLRYPELRRLFLKHYARFGNLTAAARHIRLSSETIDIFKNKHPWFAAQMEEATLAHKALIEQTIHERAIDGWLEPKFGKHGVMGHVRRYSDQLLLAYARRHIKDYREGDIVHSQVSGLVEHKHAVDAKMLTKEQRDALRLLLGPEEPEEEVKQIEVKARTEE